MKMTLEQITETLAKKISELNIEAPDDALLEHVNSLELVELVIALEDEISLDGSIVSDNAFSRTKSPFLTKSSLAAHLFERQK